jgi:hypothetical protein
MKALASSHSSTPQRGQRIGVLIKELRAYHRHEDYPIVKQHGDPVSRYGMP